MSIFTIVHVFASGKTMIYLHVIFQMLRCGYKLWEMDDSSTRFFLGLLSGYPICAFYYLINFICLAQSNKANGKGNHNGNLSSKYFKL